MVTRAFRRNDAEYLAANVLFPEDAGHPYTRIILAGLKRKSVPGGVANGIHEARAGLFASNWVSLAG